VTAGSVRRHGRRRARVPRRTEP